MKFFLKNIIPAPLIDEDLSASEIWGKEIELECSQRYFLSSGSGKGKSTLLNILYGLRKDYEGIVFAEQRKLKDFSMDDWAEWRSSKLAYLPQNLQLINHLTVYENLVLKNQLTDSYSSEEIHSFLDKLGITELKDRMVSTLSIGQQQRVALIRSLLQPFDFLLLDEPFSNLDEDNIQKALDLVHAICKQQNAGYLIATLGYDYGIKTNKMLLL